MLEDLRIKVEALGSKPLKLSVEVSADLVAGDIDLKSYVKESTDAAFDAAEKKVVELGLCKKSKN